MINKRIRLLCSHVSHAPLHFAFRDSGVAQRHGFELELDIVNVNLGEKPVKFPDGI